MDNNRIKSLFGNRRFGSIERERELSSAPGQGDIILQPSKPKSRLKVVFFVLLGLVLVTGASLTVFLWVNSNKNKSDGGATNRAVLELLNESRGDMIRIQGFVIRARDGRPQVCSLLCFSDNSKANMDDFLIKVRNFSDALSGFDLGLISNESIREKLVTLRDVVKDDLAVYGDALVLYDLFYDYVKNGYGKVYSDEILRYGDSRVTKVLKDLNDLPEDDRGQYLGVVVREIFNIALGDGYPKAYYYELMGEIEGGLEYEENKDV